MTPSPLRILLVDDDDRYVEMVEAALESTEGHHAIELLRLNDGDLAVEYLLGLGEYGDRVKYPLPEVVLLDLRMPRMDGSVVLERLKASQVTLPTICLMSSAEVSDLTRMQAPGATFRISKPDSFIALEKKLGLMVEFFRGVLDLPRGQA